MAYTLRAQGSSWLERHSDRERKGRVRSSALPPQSGSREVNAGATSHSYHHHHHHHHYCSDQDSRPLDISWPQFSLDSQVTLNAVKQTVKINHHIGCPNYSSLTNFPIFDLGSLSSTQLWRSLISNLVCVTIKQAVRKKPNPEQQCEQKNNFPMSYPVVTLCHRHAGTLQLLLIPFS